MDTHVDLASDQERTMLRDAVRGLLKQHWPADKATASAAQPAEVARLSRVLAKVKVMRRWAPMRMRAGYARS